MITTLLIFVIVLAVAYRPTPAAFCYIVATMIGDRVADSIDGGGWYLVAAAFDLLIIFTLCLPRATLRSIRLMTLSCMSITVNGIGWAIYDAGFNPIVYNMASYAIYAAAIYVIGAEDRDDVALDRVYRIRAIVRGDANSGSGGIKRGTQAV